MSIEPERLALARLPTPLIAVDAPGAGRLHIKRDDLTGVALSGNKIRKLEYLLADAQARGARRVLTCGGIQSNHCRATAVAAAQLGLKSLLFLRSDDPPAADAPWTGNLALNRLVGAEVRFITRAQYLDRNAIMEGAAGPKDYVIPEGGSNALGAWGYIRAVDELAEQWSSPPSAVVCATGSGGTIAGLAIGLRRRGLDIPAYGVCVCDDAPTFQGIAARISHNVSDRWPDLPRLKAGDFNIVEGFMGRGYALSTPEELADIAAVAQGTGLFLDPVYTGKAFRALMRPGHPFGDNPLFIHTGGIFGLLA